ncbi:MAG: hypothetical protein OT477_04205 [Chloroflexi bacterium]|nr:hypothetical protein [Chloroflexota bacterium]
MAFNLVWNNLYLIHQGKEKTTINTTINPLAQKEHPAEIEADNARWDALLETEAGQSLLDKLADEALAEHYAGKTKPMLINQLGYTMNTDTLTP